MKKYKQTSFDKKLIKLVYEHRYMQLWETVEDAIRA